MLVTVASNEWDAIVGEAVYEKISSDSFRLYGVITGQTPDEDLEFAGLEGLVNILVESANDPTIGPRESRTLPDGRVVYGIPFNNWSLINNSAAPVTVYGVVVQDVTLEVVMYWVKFEAAIMLEPEQGVTNDFFFWFDSVIPPS